MYFDMIMHVGGELRKLNTFNFEKLFNISKISCNLVV